MVAHGKRIGTSKVPDWLEGARVAPSRYNSQPWRFSVRANGEIEVGWDSSRVLPASDPTSRDLFLSLGAAVESARLRAAAAHRPLTFVPAADDDEHSIGRLIPTEPGDDRDDQRLAPFLAERRTARTAHLRFSIPPVIQLALRRETVGWGCRFQLETDRTVVRGLAALTRQAALEQMRDRARRAEMAAWFRLDDIAQASSHDGVTADCLELQGFALRIARWALDADSMVVTRLGASRLLAVREWNIVRRTAAFCLLTTQSSDRADMVRAGRLLIRLWLLATEAGLGTQALSPLLSSPRLSERCLQLFKAQGATPACVFRIGFCPPVAASSRLPATQLLANFEHARIGFSSEALR